MPFALRTQVGQRKDLLHTADRFMVNTVLCSFNTIQPSSLQLCPVFTVQQTDWIVFCYLSCYLPNYVRFDDHFRGKSGLAGPQYPSSNCVGRERFGVSGTGSNTLDVLLVTQLTVSSSLVFICHWTPDGRGIVPFMSPLQRLFQVLL